jgi:hypothetical protein
MISLVLCHAKWFVLLVQTKLSFFKPKQQVCWPFVDTLHSSDGSENKAFATLLAWWRGKK